MPMIDGLPRPTVFLSGTENVFVVFGRMQEALGKAGWSPGQIGEFLSEATDGAMSHVLLTCEKYAEIKTGLPSNTSSPPV